MSKKALLIICDGWGIGDKGKDDVIFNTPTPYWDELLKTYPASQLQASGENVGLPDGQMECFFASLPKSAPFLICSRRSRASFSSFTRICSAAAVFAMIVP